MSADPEQIIADIINPETRGNLYPHYHALREVAPIHKTHNPILHEAWVFTRHADADRLLRNPKAISDRRTTEMYNVGAGGTEYYDMMKRMLLWLDPPDHQPSARWWPACSPPGRWRRSSWPSTTW